MIARYALLIGLYQADLNEELLTPVRSFSDITCHANCAISDATPYSKVRHYVLP